MTLFAVAVLSVSFGYFIGSAAVTLGLRRKIGDLDAERAELDHKQHMLDLREACIVRREAMVEDTKARVEKAVANYLAAQRPAGVA